MTAKKSSKRKALTVTSTTKRSTARRISENGDERGLQHLSLPRDVVEPMRELSRGSGLRIGAIWDAACSAFAEKYGVRPYVDYKAPYRGAPTTLWIDSRILELCKKIADRDRVSVSRIIHSAACEYLKPARKERG